MSDNEDGGSKKSGYRLEYASSARAKCKGPKPCSGTPITKGELRFGSLVDFKGNTSFSWRHWGCVTSKIISNMKASFEDPEELDGFEDLKDEDQERVRKAYADGQVADEDIPESARKPAGDDEDEDESDGAKPKKKAAAKGKKAADDAPGKFKLEYASSGRSKCKGGCDENIGKDYFRLGHEVDFRGNKSFQFHHWGCAPQSTVSKLKQSYSKPEEIEGFSELKEAEQEKVKRAWDEGSIPEEDQGPGEPIVTEKKKPAKRAKKDDGDGEKPARKRARKAKKDDDDDDEEEKPAKKRVRKSKKDEDADEDEEEKPKSKRGAAKKAPAKEKPAPKKRASKKRDEDEDAEDLTEALDALTEEDDEEEEEAPKPKRKPASKPPSKKAAPKPSSSRRKKVEEPIEEDDED